MSIDETPTASSEGTEVSLPSRRTFLRGSGLLAGGALLAACGGDDDEPASDEPTNDTTPGPAETGSGAAPLDGGTVKVWTIPENAADEEYHRRKFDEFMKANSDVTVELTFFPPDQFANAMQLAFTGGGGDVPDVFRIAGGQGITLPAALERGWIQPLDDFVTDEFRARFPEFVFDPAVSGIYAGDEIYAVPRNNPAVAALRPLYYNIDILEANGYDAPPVTWSEFGEMATQITDDGGGDVYGTLLQGNPPTAVASGLIIQSLAGPQPYRDYHLPAISLLTGQPALSEPSMAEAIRLWQGLHREGVLTPGWEAFGLPEIVQQMVQGRLGMYLAPTHHPGLLRDANPELNFGIASPPVPDSGRAGSHPSRTGSMPFWFMSSQASSPEAAWRVLDFFGSVDYQQGAYQELAQVSIMPGVYEGIEVNPDTQAMLDIAEEFVRIRPEPGQLDAEALRFYNDLVAEGPTPNPGEINFDAVTNDRDYAELAEGYDQQLAGAIEAMLPDYDITMDAFTFPDWDPLQDYTV